MMCRHHLPVLKRIHDVVTRLSADTSQTPAENDADPEDYKENVYKILTRVYPGLLKDEENVRAFLEWLQQIENRDSKFRYRWDGYFTLRDLDLPIRHLMEAMKEVTITSVVNSKYSELMLKQEEMFGSAAFSETFCVEKAYIEDSPGGNKIGVLASVYLNASEALRGTSFFMVPMERHTSIMIESGGLPYAYCHVIPALFLRPHLCSLANDNIDFHVICQGFEYLNVVNDFRDFFKRLFESESLRNIRKNPIDPRAKLRRICVWVIRERHVALLCWDEFREETPLKPKHMLVLCDNMNGAGFDTVRLLDGFKSQLGADSGAEVYFDLVCPDFFLLEKDFVCNSYMARCTLFFSIFESAVLKCRPVLQCDNPIFTYIRARYAEFELNLFKILKDQIDRDYVVLFPVDLKANFVNIKQVKLEFVDSGNGSIGKLVYTKRGFKLDSAEKINNTGAFCVVSTEMSDPVPGYQWCTD